MTSADSNFDETWNPTAQMSPSTELVHININDFLDSSERLMTNGTETEPATMVSGSHYEEFHSPPSKNASSNNNGIKIEAYSLACGKNPSSSPVEMEVSLPDSQNESDANENEISDPVNNRNEIGIHNNHNHEVTDAVVQGVMFEKIPRIKQEIITENPPTTSLPSVERKYTRKMGEYYLCPSCQRKFVTSDCVAEHLTYCSIDLCSDSDDGDSDDNYDYAADWIIDPIDLDFFLCTLQTGGVNPDPTNKAEEDAIAVASRFTCENENCLKTFTTKQDLTRHRWSHRSTNNSGSGQILSCEFCTKECCSPFSLRRHVDKFHSERKIQALFPNYKSVASGLRPRSSNKTKSTSTYISVPNIRSHTGTVTRKLLPSNLSIDPSKEKSYNCDQCDQKFFLQMHLEDHKATHVNDYPFMCGECFECFQTEADLNHHNTESHPMGPGLGQGQTETEDVDPLEIVYESKTKNDNESSTVMKNGTALNQNKVTLTQILTNTSASVTCDAKPQNFYCAKCCTIFPSIETLSCHAAVCSQLLSNYPLDHDYIKWKHPCFPCRRSFPSAKEHFQHCVEFHRIRSCFIARMQKLGKFLKSKPVKTTTTAPPPLPPPSKSQKVQCNSGSIVNPVPASISNANTKNSLKSSSKPFQRVGKKVRVHNSSERARRADMASSFVQLRNLIPALKFQKYVSRVISKVSTLTEATTYVKQLKLVEKQFIRAKDREMARNTILRNRLAALNPGVSIAHPQHQVMIFGCL